MGLLALGLAAVGAAAQQAPTPMCEVPDAALAALPDPPTGFGYEATSPAPYWETDLGVGHVHRAPEELAGPPGDGSWMQRVQLPLSERPGLQPFAWLARGWIVTRDGTREALSLASMLETGYEEASFIALERQDDWLRIRYGGEEQAPRSAWIPECALSAGPVRLAYSPWTEWLSSDEISPLFVRDGRPLALREEPSDTSPAVTDVSNEDALHPIEIRGAWMRVTLRQPSDYCVPDVVATSREGWVRWVAEDGGPRLWYSTRGC